MLKEPLRIPLAWPLENRAGNFDKDAIRRNTVLEKAPDGVFVLKRPGTSSQVYAGTGVGQGGTFFSGAVCHVSGDAFNVSAPTNTGTDGSAFTLLTNGSWNGRYIAASCVFLDRLWIMAGLTSVANQSSDVWSSTDGTTWVAHGAAPWAPRRGFSCVVLGSKMYITGGYDGTTFYNDVWSSENGTDWKQETAAAPFLPRSNITFIAGASGMYVIGGTSAFFTAHDDVWFSADGAQWVRLGGPFGWATRSNAGGCYYDNRLWLIGGQNNAGVLQNDVWSSPDGVVWIQETAAAFSASANPARELMGVCVYGGRMWAIGGITGAGETAEVFRSNAQGVGAWNLITAAPGFTARAAPCVQAFRSPTTVNTYRYPTLWVYAGGVGFSKQVWYGNLNASASASTALSPGVALQPFQFTSFQTNTRLLFKNQAKLWVYEGNTITQVNDRGYPAETVPGIVVFGGSAFVMDPSGLIYNCDLDNPFYWPAVNVLGADYEDDRGVYLVKYKNYVMALGEFTTQLFYDAGLQFGSPLKPYLNANVKVGCASSFTVQEMKDTVIWVGRSEENNFQVYAMEGAAPKVISTPYVDKILNVYGVSTIRSFIASAGGHSYYGLALGSGTTAPSLVFDFTSGEWQPWNVASGAPVSYSAFIVDLFTQTNLVQDPVSGDLKIYKSTYYQDNGATPFNVYIRTGLFDAGTKRMKFWGRLDVVGDQTASLPTISYTDDDYQTYSTPRAVDMSTVRPALFRNGASRRRAWVYQQQDNEPMRMQWLEQQFELGV